MIMTRLLLIAVLACAGVGCASHARPTTAPAHVSASVDSNQLGQLKLENPIAKCITFSPLRLNTSGELVLLRISYEKKRVVAECGCLSQILRYSVSESVAVDTQLRDYERTFGRIAPRESRGELEIALATDGSLFDLKRAKLTIDCAPPD